MFGERGPELVRAPGAGRQPDQEPRLQCDERENPRTVVGPSYGSWCFLIPRVSSTRPRDVRRRSQP